MEKKLKNFFLEALEILANGKKVNNNLLEIKDELKNTIKSINSILNLKGENEFRYERNNKFLFPVVFNTVPTKVKLVYLGLNPFLNDETVKEKIKAGESLESYTEFYIGYKTYYHVLGIDEKKKMSTYYQTLGNILNYFKCGNYLNWRDHFTIEIEKELGLKKYYTDLLDSVPTMVAETIPFHSMKTSTIDLKTLKKLISENESFKLYILKLKEIIEESLEDNGYIIADGKAATSACKLLYEDEKDFKKIKRHKVGSKIVEVYKYKNRNIILFHQSLNKVSGFNGKKQISSAFKEIEDFFKSDGFL